MYTHFYTPKTLSKKNWKLFTDMVKDFLTQLPASLPSFKGFEYSEFFPVDIVDYTGNPGTKPTIDDEIIALNGINLSATGGKDHSCESLTLTRKKQDTFNFCKTDRKPYDFAVVGILMIYSRFGATFKSDKEKVGIARWDYIQNMVNKIVFAHELKELLKRHNAEISFWVPMCCDTQGFAGERMTVTMNGKETVVADGWEINKKNIISNMLEMD